MLRSAAIAVVPGFALAVVVVLFLTDVVHVGCEQADLPGVGVRWVDCPDGIGYVIPAMGIMALVGTVALVVGVRRLAVQLAADDAAAARSLARDLAVLGAVPVVVVLPLGLLGASSALAVVLSIAVGTAGVLVLALQRRAQVGPCLTAAVVTTGAAGYAFVAAPFALIPIALLLSAAAATRAATRFRGAARAVAH